MAWTKGDILNQALEELGLPTYDFDMSPEDLTACLNRLESLMSKDGVGTALGFNFAGAPNASTTAQASDLADNAVYAVALALSERIAPVFAVQLNADQRLNIFNGKMDMLTIIANIPQSQRPNTAPIGAGNRAYKSDTNSEFFIESPDELQAATVYTVVTN